MDLKNNNIAGLGSENDPVGKVTGFFLFRNLINSYANDKVADDNVRKNIKKYGVASLILGLIAFAISFCCMLGSVVGIQAEGFSFFLLTIINIVGGVIISLLLSIYSFVFAVMQIRLNRKAVGVIGIVLSVLAMAASVVLVVFMII